MMHADTSSRRRLMILRYCLALILCCIVQTTIYSNTADAQKRVALVVGIDNYANLEPRSQLKKARNDASAIAQALKDLDFEVIQKIDLTRSSFNLAWQEFLDALKPGDTAAFYFAGHGIELGGRNYLLPQDVPNVRPGRDELLKRESLSLQEFLADLREKGTGLNLVILDACRDNPFIQLAGRSVGGTRGLVVTEPPEGTFIMYSAGTGESALDRLDDNDANPNSVYTRQLIPLLKNSPLSLTEIAEQVRVGVRQMAASVQHRQTPAYYNQVLGRVCLAGCEKKRISTQSSGGLDDLMASCIKDPVHPASGDISNRMAKELNSKSLQYGWYDDVPGATGTRASKKRIEFIKNVTSIASHNEDLKIEYEWQNGYLRLRAAAPKSIGTRGIAPPGTPVEYPRQLGSRFQGIWVQDNSYECVELHVGPTGEAKGRWGIKTGELDSEIFMRRRN